MSLAFFWWSHLRSPSERHAKKHRISTDAYPCFCPCLRAQTDAEALGNGHEDKGMRDELAKPEGVQYDSPAFEKHTHPPSRQFSSEVHPATPDTETDFDWNETDSSDEEEREAAKHAREEEIADKHRHNVKRAKRLRKVYLACMRISRPVRTVLMALVGGGVLFIPALVVFTRYGPSNSSSVVRDNVKVWSLWLTVVWMSACGTSIFVDAIPWLASKISILLVGLYPQAVKQKVTRASCLLFSCPVGASCLRHFPSSSF